MTDEIKTRKESLRAEAVRARGLLGLDAAESKALVDLFLANIVIPKDAVVGAYWPKDRELDIRPMMDEILDRGVSLALPVVDGQSKILKFAKWDNTIDLVEGRFGVCHPVLNEGTQYLEPDIFIVPMLAFDRRGNRLGFGGGYYDATLAHYRAKKEILIVGLAYAQQACLFNLPAEPHDIKMDWVITQQQAHKF